MGLVFQKSNIKFPKYLQTITQTFKIKMDMLLKLGAHMDNLRQKTALQLLKTVCRPTIEYAPAIIPYTVKAITRTDQIQLQTLMKILGVEFSTLGAAI